jgi:hypothetical protein
MVDNGVEQLRKRMTRAQQSLGQRDGPWRLEQLDSRIG